MSIKAVKSLPLDKNVLFLGILGDVRILLGRVMFIKDV